MPKIVMGVVLARCPRGSAGHTCAVMNWAVGFRQLGWDVWIAEHIDGKEMEPAPDGSEKSPQETFWEACCLEFGFEKNACLIVNGNAPNMEAFREFAAGADAFLNYSGQFKKMELLGARAKKIYLDVDPGFTQLWAGVCHSDMNFEGHDLFVTIGSNFGSEDLRLPATSQRWIPTLPVVAAGTWRQMAGLPRKEGNPEWTTVAHWYGYNNIHWNGWEYAGKRESFLSMIGVPDLAGTRVTVATDLQREWGDYEEFESRGWKFLKSSDVCADIPTYLRFLASSRGELGIAKAGYITSRGGWISDRSLVYLALGRPVVLQETGWSGHVKPDGGLIPFSTPEECARAMSAVNSDHAGHSKAAQELAGTVFSPEAVLGSLIAKF